MTRKEIESEKKDFIVFIIIGIVMHIATISTIIVQFFPNGALEVTTAGILKAIFFGIIMTGTLVVYWINMTRYAKAIKNAEKKLEGK